MNYRTFGNTGIQVSALGFGTMRFPTLEDSSGNKQINEPEAIQMLRHAIDQGVNYIDTAYPYHDGMSEIVTGKALQDGYREKVYLADKMPLWAVEKQEDFDRILDEQLQKLNVEYIDFYLLHAISKDRWENVVLKYDLLSKMKEAKAAGKIRHIGFSFHDSYDVFMEVLNGFDGWEFCQIQMNYINVNDQATLKGMEEAAKRGLGVVIMEPLLGGKLANPSKNVTEALSDKKTPVEWALDFLWNRPEVSLLLSGMSDMQQTKDNLLYASRSEIGMLKEEDLRMLAKAKKIYDTMALVACTKCAYCMPCPAGLNIPKIFEAYNQTATLGPKKAGETYHSFETKADACKTCHACEKVCPQGLKISQIMKDVTRVFQEA